MQFVTVGGHAVNLHGYRPPAEGADPARVRSVAAEAAVHAALTEAAACYIGCDIDPATGLYLHPSATYHCA